MTIAQRIELRRLGYTKEEVNAMIEEERQEAQNPPAAEVTPEPAPAAEATPEPAPASDPARDLLAAINDLTMTLRGHKLNTVDQPTSTQPQTAEDVFNSILKG